MRNNNNLVSVLGNAFAEIPKRLKDPFLLGMLGLVIVLGVVAVVRTNIYVTIVIALAVVLLFSLYLYYLWRISVSTAEQVTLRLAKQTEQMALDLAKNITFAINDQGYINGVETKMNFGASLIRAIQKTKEESNRDDDHIKALEAMTQEFKYAFKVPDSIL